MKSIFKMFAFGLPLSVPLALPVSASINSEMRKLSFDVFLDDREIGFQNFTVTPTSLGKRVETQAKFEVKVLRFTAFAYDHRNTEVWRDGCLQTIEARTDSNGKLQAVRGEDRGDAFVVSTAESEQGIDLSIAYALGGGEWVSLDSKLDSGRMLRYRRSALELGGLN